MPTPDPTKDESHQHAGKQPAETKTQDKETFIQQAINDAVDNMKDDLPIMMQLCKIKEATCRAEKLFEDREAMLKDQTMDPRNPKEVLIEQGISPNPGPSKARKSKSHFRKFAVTMISMLITAEGRPLG